MGAKADASRTRILEAARTLFAEKGFARVSMADVCNTAAISRGGLYRYFSSTEELFGALVRQEQALAAAALERAQANAVPAKRVLETFLTARLAQLLDPKRCYDKGELPDECSEVRTLLIERAKSSVAIVAALIRLGTEQGDYRCDTPEAAAAHILWLLEGMAKHNALLPLTQTDIDGQLCLIRRLLG